MYICTIVIKVHDCFGIVYTYIHRECRRVRQNDNNEKFYEVVKLIHAFFYNQYRSRRGHKLGGFRRRGVRWWSACEAPAGSYWNQTLDHKLSLSLSLALAIAFYSQRAYEEHNLNHFQPPPLFPTHLTYHRLLYTTSNYPSVSSWTTPCIFRLHPLKQISYMYIHVLCQKWSQDWYHKHHSHICGKWVVLSFLESFNDWGDYFFFLLN